MNVGLLLPWLMIAKISFLFYVVILLLFFISLTSFAVNKAGNISCPPASAINLTINPSKSTLGLVLCNYNASGKNFYFSQLLGKTKCQKPKRLINSQIQQLDESKFLICTYETENGTGQIVLSSKPLSS